MGQVVPRQGRFHGLAGGELHLGLQVDEVGRDLAPLRVEVDADLDHVPIGLGQRIERPELRPRNGLADPRDRPLQAPLVERAGKRLARDLGLLALADPLHVGLVDLGQDDHPAAVGQLQNRRRPEDLSRTQEHLEHGAVAGGPDDRPLPLGLGKLLASSSSDSTEIVLSTWFLPAIAASRSASAAATPSLPDSFPFS